MAALSKEAATTALEDAVKRVLPDAMVRALHAGAELSPRDPLRVLYGEDAGVVAERVLAARQVTALRLLFTRRRPTAEEAGDLLHHAVLRGVNPAVVTAILDAGADPSHRNERQMTPLHIVHRVDVAKVLVDAGAQLDAASRAGVRPIDAAARYSQDGQRKLILQLLLTSGADLSLCRHALVSAVDADSGRDRTRVRHVLVLPVLLQWGADPGADPRVMKRALGLLDQRVRGGCVGEAASDRVQVRLLRRTAAWHRRRHLLLAIRSRVDGVIAAVYAAGGSTAAATTAAGDGGSS